MNRLTITMILVLLAIILIGPNAHSIPLSYTEDFSSAAYKDALNTTADWNTTDGELKLFDLPLFAGNYNTPGFAVDVAVAGNLAFVADMSNGLQVIDITDPDNPVLVGSYNTPDSAAGVVVDGDLAFVADSASGLQIIDITNPSNPTWLGSYNTPGSAVDVAIDGNLAFVADRHSGIQIIDITDPANPSLVGSYNTPGLAFGIAVAGNLVYVADSSRVHVIDVTNPASPIPVSNYDSPGLAYRIAVAGNLAFVAVGNSGLEIIDISDSSNLFYVGSYNTPGSARDIAVAGDLAFVADYGSGLQMIDISNPASPFHVSTYNTQDNAQGVVVAGEHAFLADYTSGLDVIKISIPVDPVALGIYQTWFDSKSIFVNGNYAFMASGGENFQIFDTTDLNNPILVADYTIPGDAVDVTVVGDLAIVMAWSGGFYMIDISDPANPAPVSNYYLQHGGAALAVAGDYVFAADGSWGLKVIDISDPANPTSAGSLYTEYASDVAIAGNLAFVADGSSGLLVIDISDPANPNQIGSYDTPGDAYRVAVAGDLAFVIDYQLGLRVIDITDPTNPVPVGDFAPYGYWNDVAVAGDLAYLSNGTYGLVTVDISDPANISEVSHTIFEDQSFSSVAVSGNHAFVADDALGLRVLQVLQSEVDTKRILGQSLTVAATEDTFSIVRLTAAQAGDVTWEITADGGAFWQKLWNYDGVTLESPGTDLRWRSTHHWSLDSNPIVSGLTLDFYNNFAPITAITDVAGDQGGRVNVAIERSGYDFANAVPHQVAGYNVYRRVDSGLLAGKGLDTTQGTNGEKLLTPSGEQAWALPNENTVSNESGSYVLGKSGTAKSSSFPPGTWKIVSTVFATQSANYLVEATTDTDSTAAGVDWSVYLVTTHTTTPAVWFASQPDSGYSVDNIAPGVPSNLSANYQADGVALEWDDAPESDFQYFRIYRSSDSGFIPGPENLVHETATSAWADAMNDPWDLHYKITALDFVGNESEVGSLDSVSGAPEVSVQTRNTLLGAVPNPFNPSTKLAFEMASAGHARLRVYDAAGRLVVTLVDEHRSEGQHQVIWNGRDESGRMASTGVYLYRFDTGHFVETKRMTLVK